MCYHETLTFLICTHKLKTTSICPGYLRHEQKTLGPASKRHADDGSAHLSYLQCRNLVNERFIVVALCPECNIEEQHQYGYSAKALGRSDWTDYSLGRDAYYSDAGKDGMGDKRYKKRAGMRNGELVKRRIEGITWSLDDGSHEYGREERGERDEDRYRIDEQYYGGDRRFYDSNDRYDGQGRDGRR